MTDIFTFHLANPQDARPRKIELFVYSKIFLVNEHPYTLFKHSCLIFYCLRNILSQKISNFDEEKARGLVYQETNYNSKTEKALRNVVSWED